MKNNKKSVNNINKSGLGLPKIKYPLEFKKKILKKDSEAVSLAIGAVIAILCLIFLISTLLDVRLIGLIVSDENVSVNESVNESLLNESLINDTLFNESLINETLNESLINETVLNESLPQEIIEGDEEEEDEGDGEGEDGGIPLQSAGIINISWISPTPADGGIVNQRSLTLNTSTEGVGNRSAFFDWHRTLVGYWSMDAYNNTGVFDNSSYDNFGDFGGGVGVDNVTGGKYGNALEFDGTDDTILIPYDDNFDMNANFSVSFWFKPDNAITDPPTTGLISKSSSATNSHNDWVVFWESGDNGRLRWGSYGGNIQTDTNSWGADTWYFITVLHYNSSYAKIYVNGVEDNYNNDYDPGAVDGSQDNPIRLGMSHTTSGSHYFDGMIDEVKIFSRVLSDAEIKASYNNAQYRLYAELVELNEQTYNYSAYVIDSNGNLNITDLRNVTVKLLEFADNGSLQQNVDLCGELNTSNAVYTLVNNVDSTETCFNITAENITLDCDGYEIEYSYNGTLGYGVYTSQNNITIQNCIVTEGSSSTNSKYAILFDGNESRIINNNITTSGQTSYGIHIKRSFNSLISQNNVLTSGKEANCIDVYQGSGNTLAGNIVSGSYDANGIVIYQSNGNNISGNIANNNDYTGISLYDGSSNNLVENNTANDNTDYGIHVFRGDDNHLINNNCTSNNQHGIYVNDNANRNILTNNTANGNNNYGIHIRWYSNSNNLTGNTANNNNLGIYFYYAVDNNLIANSTFNDNNEYGIYLQRAGSNTLSNITTKSNNIYDFFILPEGESYCNNQVTGITGTGGKPIAYYSSSVTLEHWGNNFSEIILCNADNSVLNNITLNYAGEKNNGLLLSYTNDANLTDVYVNNSYWGIYARDSHRNRFDKITAQDNAVDGLYFYTCSHNILTNITSLYNDDDGIGLLWYADNNTFTDIVVRNNSGIGLNFYPYNDDNKITNATIKYNGGRGFDLDGTSGVFIGMDIQHNGGDGFYMRSGGHSITNSTSSHNAGSGVVIRSNTILRNIIAEDNGYEGIYFAYGDNTIENCSLRNNGRYGIWFDYWDPNRNNITNVLIENSGDRGLYLRRASHNIFQDVNISNSTNYDVYIGANADALNNTFINVSYDKSKEYVQGGNYELIRKWYYQAYVNNTLGHDVNNAVLSAYNVTGDLELSLVTNNSGWTPVTEITDYINLGGVRSYYSDYLINVTHPAYEAENESYNVTLYENKLDNLFTMNVSLYVNITYPQNTTYGINVSELNYTHFEGESCWYSRDGGVSNSSPVNAGQNFTGMLASEGNNNWIVWCNDSAGKEFADNVMFYQDSIPPELHEDNISVINETGDVDGEIIRTSNVTFNVTDDDYDSVWIIIWKGVIGLSDILFHGMLSLIGGIWTTTVQTNVSWPVGEINYTIYANDSAGTEVNVSDTFVVNLTTVYVYNCTDPNQSASAYILQNNISSDTTCFNIDSDDVTIDCNGHTVFYNTNGVSNNPGISASNKNHVVIKNCILKEGASSAAQRSYGIQLYDSSNVIIENNIIDVQSNSHAIYIEGPSTSNNLIRNNIIYGKNQSGYADQGIYIDGNCLGVSCASYSNEISNNHIYGCSGTGIHIAEFIYSTVIKNNVVNHGLNNGIVVDGWAYYSEVYNNTANNNAQDGIVIYGISLAIPSNNTVRDNIANNNSRYGINIIRNTNVTVKDNIIKDNKQFDFAIDPQGASRCYGVHFYNQVGTDNKPVQYVTGSATLQNLDVAELVLCGADGSTINNITLAPPIKSNGVFITYTNGATISNLNITGAGYGVYASNSPSISITGSEIRDNGNEGIYLLGCDGSSITNCAITNNSGHGVMLDATDWTNVSYNNLSNNAKHGVALQRQVFDGPDHNRIISNFIRYNGQDGVKWPGIYSTNLTVYNNTMEHNLGIAVEMGDATYAFIDSNTIRNHSSHGIQWFSGNNIHVSNNLIENMGGMGINSDHTWDNNNNDIENNTIKNTTNGMRIQGHNNTIINNNIINVRNDGILFAGASVVDNLAEYNKIDGSGDDGIDVYDVGDRNVTVRHNIIGNSSNHGIHVREGSANCVFINNSVINNTHGLALFWGADNNSFFNNTALDSRERAVSITAGVNIWGDPMYGRRCHSNRFFGNVFNNSKEEILVWGYANHNYFEDNMMINSSGNGFHIDRHSENVTLISNTIIDTEYGILLTENASNNIFLHNTIEESREYAIKVYDNSSYNWFAWNKFSNNDKGVLINYSSSHNFFEQSVMDPINEDVRVIGNSNSTNNTFLNVTYDLSEEYVAPGSELIRLWYYRAHAKWVNGTPVVGANVTLKNRTGDLEFRLWTNETNGIETGWTIIEIITDYINNGTRNFYSLYNATAIKNPVSQHDYNVTEEMNNLSDLFLFGVSIVEVNITYPLNTNYSVNVSELNYTSNFVGGTADSCWYSLNNGAVNSSPVSVGVNFTNVVSNEGSNTWTIWCNDSFGNAGNDSIIFTVDTIPPAIGDTDVFDENGVIVDVIVPGTNLTFNLTDEGDYDSVWITIWEGLVGEDILFEGLLTLVGDNWTVSVETNTSWPTSDLNFTVYANDSVGNEGSRNDSTGVPAPFCGDGVCNGAETCNSCPADCGTCGGGGDGGGDDYCEDGYVLNCSEWSECEDGRRFRNCEMYNTDCTTRTEAEVESCEMPEEEHPAPPEECICDDFIEMEGVFNYDDYLPGLCIYPNGSLSDIQCYPGDDVVINETPEGDVVVYHNGRVKARLRLIDSFYYKKLNIHMPMDTDMELPSVPEIMPFRDYCPWWCWLWLLILLLMLLAAIIYTLTREEKEYITPGSIMTGDAEPAKVRRPWQLRPWFGIKDPKPMRPISTKADHGTVQ
jgi:parallel beta-helix repeat protein